MEFNFKVVGDTEVIEKLGRFPNSLRKQLKETVESLSIRFNRKVKQDKLSGQVLNVRTGRLRRSMSYNVTEARAKILGSIGTNVKYARRHEFGGKSFLRSQLSEFKAQARKELLSAVRAGVDKSL